MQVAPHGRGQIEPAGRAPRRPGRAETGQRGPDPSRELRGQRVGEACDERAQLGQPCLREAAGHRQHRVQQVDRGPDAIRVDGQHRVEPPALGGPGQHFVPYRGTEKIFKILQPDPHFRVRRLASRPAPVHRVGAFAAPGPVELVERGGEPPPLR